MNDTKWQNPIETLLLIVIEEAKIGKMVSRKSKFAELNIVMRNLICTDAMI